jgi:hypothetical protein
MACGVRYSAGFEAFPGGQRFTNEWLPDRHCSPSRRGSPPAVRRGDEQVPTYHRDRSAALREPRTSPSAPSILPAREIARASSATPPGLHWTSDANFAIASVAEKWSAPPTVWAIRSGALLLPTLDHVFADVLLWQPVTSGDAFLTQLLRLKVAADTFAGIEGTTTKQLRSQLGAGATLEIAGYELNPDLVLPMAATNLQTWGNPPRSTAWLETGVDPAGAPSPASQRVADAWSTHGAVVVQKYVVGEQFWLTQEIAENRTIAEASVTALEGVPA